MYDGPVIDAHHHFWELSSGRYPWLSQPEAGIAALGDIAYLRRDYLPADYARDGLDMDRLRARFVLATYHTVIAHLTGADTKAPLAEAQRILDEAQETVHRRDRDLHDTHGNQLVSRPTIHTTYQFGYLFMADTLCYWHRELAQVQSILGDTSVIAPACVF